MADRDSEDFNPEDHFDFFEEPTEEDFELLKKENDRISQLPLFKSARHIFELTKIICEVIRDDHPFAMVKQIMIEDAMMLAPKIAGAEGGDLYSLRMENAVLIQHHAKQLLLHLHTLSQEKLIDGRYSEVLRDEVEKFRLLFVQWVTGFDKSNDYYDGWIRFSELPE